MCHLTTFNRNILRLYAQISPIIGHYIYYLCIQYANFVCEVHTYKKPTKPFVSSQLTIQMTNTNMESQIRNSLQTQILHRFPKRFSRFFVCVSKKSASEKSQIFDFSLALFFDRETAVVLCDINIECF